MKGFFAGSEVASKGPPPLLPRCGACGLYKSCQSAKMPLSGEGERKILLLGEAPGKTEDEEGVQFVGVTGRVLERKLRNLGIRMRRDCWLHNALACRPPGNRSPTSDEIGHCRPFFTKAMDELRPEIIIPMGGAAVRSVIGPLWKEDTGGISRWVGARIPCQEHNAWICPTYHPSYVMRETSDKNPVPEMFFERHLAAAVDLNGRPFDAVPDYASEVEILYDSTEAARVLRRMIERPGWVAFDFETNMLKPDSDRGEIVSCAVCWEGRKTIAYPWDGAAVDATRELLRSRHPKIASNAKFEERWSRARLGTRVRNWKWDTMLAAHVLDCRPGVTSVKFQALVLLGQSIYNEHIERYMRAEDPTAVNQIVEEVGLPHLLEYNGLDALLEYHVAMKQQELLGWDKS